MCRGFRVRRDCATTGKSHAVAGRGFGGAKPDSRRDRSRKRGDRAKVAAVAGAAAVSAASKSHPGAPQFLRALLKPLEDGLHLGEHMIAGAAAALVAVAAMHPLDTLKTVAQSTSTSVASPGAVQLGSGPAGMIAAARMCVSRGGPLALYGGVGASVSGQVPAGAIKLAVYETASQWARKRWPDGNQSTIELVSAAVAFVACSVVLIPSEVLKQRMQAGQFPTIGACIAGIWKQDKLRGFYTGYGATLMRDIPYSMLEFGLFAQFKRLLRTAVQRPRLTAKEEWAMGGLAGGFTGLLTTPLDLAKTRLMTQHLTTSTQAAATTATYRGIGDVFTKVIQTDGAQGLFRGAPARVTWLIPFTAIYFGVHGMSKRILLERKQKAHTFSQTPVAKRSRKSTSK